METPKRLLNRNYCLFYQGQVVSRLGTQIESIVAILWLTETFREGKLLGLLGLMTGIPSVLFGIVGGTLADRYSRQRIIVICDALSGMAALTLSTMFFFIPQQKDLLAAGVLSVAAFVAVAESFASPAMGAAVPDLVPPGMIARANSMGQFSIQVTGAVGRAFGGILYSALGVFWVVLMNGFSYLYAALSESVIRIPQRIPESSPGWRKRVQDFKKDTRDGFAFMWTRPGLRNLVLGSSMVTFFTAPLMVLFSFYVKDFLKAPDSWFGFILAAYGIGSMAGFVLAGVLMLRGQARSWSTLGCMMLLNAGFGVLAFVREPFAALLLVFAGGMASGYAMVNVITVLQIVTPSEWRGRVFGVLSTVSGSLGPVGAGVGSLIYDATGQNIPGMYLGCAVLMSLIVLWLLLNREVRRYLASEPEPEAKQRFYGEIQQVEAK